MGKYVRPITYKGKEILFMDAKGVDEEGGVAAWEEMRLELKKRGNVRLTLIDGTGISITPAVLRKAKESSSGGKADPNSRSVFVGLSQIQRTTAELVARSMNLNVHFCNTLEEGKEWLVKEDEKLRKG